MYVVVLCFIQQTLTVAGQLGCIALQLLVLEDNTHMPMLSFTSMQGFPAPCFDSYSSMHEVAM